jgi:hypothetical protein
MLTKNIPTKPYVLIKSIFLLTENKFMNKQIKKLLWCIYHENYWPALSLYDYFG